MFISLLYNSSTATDGSLITVSSLRSAAVVDSDSVCHLIGETTQPSQQKLPPPRMTAHPVIVCSIVVHFQRLEKRTIKRLDVMSALGRRSTSNSIYHTADIEFPSVEQC